MGNRLSIKIISMSKSFPMDYPKMQKNSSSMGKSFPIFAKFNG